MTDPERDWTTVCDEAEATNYVPFDNATVRALKACIICHLTDVRAVRQRIIELGFDRPLAPPPQAG